MDTIEIYFEKIDVKDEEIKIIRELVITDNPDQVVILLNSIDNEYKSKSHLLV